MKHILVLFFIIMSVVGLYSQEQINWYTWDEGMTKAQEEQKKFIVDMYTDWCGWCKRMDKVTFQNPEIAAYINEHFIAIKFDAEQKGEINFKGINYEFIDSGRRGYHGLAAQLTDDRLSYPTVIFLDEQQEVIQALRGFIDAETFAPVVTYFANDLFLTTPWATFLRKYNDDNVQFKKINHARLVKGQ